MDLIQEIAKILKLEASLSGEDSWIFEDGPIDFSTKTDNRPAPTHLELSNPTTSIDQSREKTPPMYPPSQVDTAQAKVEQEIVKLQTQNKGNFSSKTLKDLHSSLKVRTQQSYDNSTLLESKDLKTFNHALYNHEWYQNQQSQEDHHLNLIVGLGPSHPKLMVINFQPYPEDIQIRQPFAGAAGELLRNMLKAIGLEKNLSYLSYLDHSSNPKRRLPREVKMLKDHLQKEIELVQPKAILLMGPELAEILLHESNLGDLVEKKMEFMGIPTFGTYPLHYMTHDPGWKKPAWTTLQLLKSNL